MLGDVIKNRRETLQGALAALLAAGASGTAVARSDGHRSNATDQPSCDLQVPGDHDTIQAAVDAAGVGDTVCVQPGTYEGTVDIDARGLTLRATNPREATIDATGENLAITVDTKGVTIEGFEIVGDGDTRAGVSIRTSRGATDNITVANNHIHGMARAGDGIEQSQCWGVIAWGDDPVGGLTIEDNLIAAIGGAPNDLPVGTGIDLKEVEGSAPGEGAVVARNTIRNVVDGRFGIFGAGVDLPGTAISIQPSDAEQSGAGDPATILRGNRIDGASMDVALGEVGLTRVLDNE